MAWCLTKDQESKFRNALVSGEIDPFKLAEMSSGERKALFEKHVDGENAININSLFESKLLLKNQQQGFKSWAKRALGMSPKVSRDLLSKIERLDEIGVLEPKDLKSFKEDLARTRLGFGITFEEAKTINELSEARVESKEMWEAEVEKHPEWQKDSLGTRDEWKDNQARLDYGLKQVVMENYVNDLKLDAVNRKVSLREDPIRAILNPIKEAPGNFSNIAKSLMASIDNSFFGRQGIKNLYGSPAQKRIWARNFVKSFGDIAGELRRGRKATGLGPVDFIKADVYSRPNALNGKYKAGNYQLGVLHEEVFPTSAPEKIPGLGRLFRASETAFNGAALRMRADLADMLISKMDAQGINSLNPDQARAAGHLVGSLTGRGSLGKATTMSKELNLILWSARFFKGNIDTLTAHQFDKKATKFTKTEARKNLVSIVAHIGGIMLLAKFLDPDSVDEDPRSTNFGKIKKEMINFRDQVGDKKFKEASEKYNKEYDEWFVKVVEKQDYKNLSDEGKEKTIADAKKAIKKKILDEYGYDPTDEKPDTLEELKEKDVIEKLKPLQSMIDKAVKVIAKIDLVSDALASEGREGMSPEQRTRFDEIKQRIDGLVGLIASRRKSKLLSPQRIDVLTDEVNRLMKEGNDLLTAPAPPEEPGQKTYKVVNNIGKNPKFSEVKPKDSVDTAIRNAAKEFNVPSELLFDISFAESTLDTTKQNNKSTAGGLFQFLDASWKQAMRELGLPEDTPKTDEVASARAAAMVISKGRLSWWDASKKDPENNQRWGDYYTDEELKLYDRRLKK
jgi:hypothetical protein